MKKQILTILLILLTVIGYSQISTTIGFDIKNMVVGSEQTNNNPSLDLIIGFKARENNLEIGLNYERFQKINYQDYSVTVGFYHESTNKKNLFYSNLEFGQIIREENIGHFYHGVNIGYTYSINQHLGIVLETNIANRTDLGNYWRQSNFVKLEYKL